MRLAKRVSTLSFLPIVLVTGLASGLTNIPAAQAADAAPSAEAEPRAEGPRQRFREGMRERMMEHRAALDRKLTVGQIKEIAEGRLAMSGNSNLKVGKVTAKEEGVVAVDIVTKTGALVETREISTRTGGPAARERATAEHGGRGRGHGPRGMGGSDHQGRQAAGRDLKLTLEQAKKLAEAQLIMRGNPNLKVGAVKEKDADTITVDIVASDNSLVTQREIDRHSGRSKHNRG